MDRFKGLRRVVAVLAVLFVSGLALLVWMIPVRSFLTWAVVVAQAVVVIYYTVLSVGLIREAEEREKTEVFALAERMGGDLEGAIRRMASERGTETPEVTIRTIIDNA